jgi:cyclic-di-GMP phosphodiesterase TipF (flagellum assembly factor)
MPKKQKKIKNRLSDMWNGEIALPPSARWAVPGALAAAGMVVVGLLAGAGASADFLFLIAMMMGLSGLIGYDLAARRRWERDTSRKLKHLTVNHDRLVREVARNRSDIAILKEGLSDMASAAETQGRRMHAANSAEAQMLEMVVQRLGMLGEKPRARVQTAHDANILELELAPPPARPVPMTALDEELNTDLGFLTDGTIADLIHHAVRNDEIDVYVQPIVSLPQRKHRFYETFARLRAGEGVTMPASRYMELAKREQMNAAIDNLLLLRCLSILRARRDDEGMPYFINVSAATLNDRSFMNDLVAFLSQHRRMAAQLVFELPQAEIESMNETMREIIGGLSKLGCRFSMDCVKRRQLNVHFLKSHHVRFVKMDASWIIKEARDKTGFSRIARFKKQMDAAGIDLIVEKIETEPMLRELLDFSIDYGQGYLFGKPDIWTTYNNARKAA